MSNTNDYSKLSTEELLTKQKSLANWQKIFIAFAVISTLMTLYAVYKDTVGKHAFFILGSLFLMIINSNKLKKVEEEINKRKQ
jgi:hypothetical protein